MKTILALDQGTTSSRAILFETEGQVLGVAQREFSNSSHGQGGSSTTRATSRHAVGNRAGVLAETQWPRARSAAIGITNQRETTVVWDRATGAPIHPAIVWQDRRTASGCAALKEAGHEGLVRAAHGTAARPVLRRDEGGLDPRPRPGRAGARRAGRPRVRHRGPWLVWHLTGARSTRRTPRTRHGPCSSILRQGGWNDELCALFEVAARRCSPRSGDSSGSFGEAWSRACHGLTIAGIAGDQQAALFGQACFAPGLAKTTYGTGLLRAAQHGDAPASSPNIGCSRHGRVARERAGPTRSRAACSSAAAVVQWLRDGLGLIAKAGDVEALAGQRPRQRRRRPRAGLRRTRARPTGIRPRAARCSD